MSCTRDIESLRGIYSHLRQKSSITWEVCTIINVIDLLIAVMHDLLAELLGDGPFTAVRSRPRCRRAEPTAITKTQTGLTVTAYLDRRSYPCGLKPTPQQVASLRLQRHEVLPQWNYTIKPQM